MARAPASPPRHWPSALPLLLLAVVLAVPPTPGQVGNTLQVTAIDIVGPAPQWVVPAGGTIDQAQPTDTTVQVTMKNTGGQTSPGYTIRYFWEQGGIRQDLDEDPARSFDTGDPLDSQDSREHTIEWRLQAGDDGRARQAGTGDIVVRLEGTSPREWRRTVTVPIHDFGVQVLGGDQAIGVDGTAVWRVLLVNNGNVPEALSATFSADHARLDERLLAPQATVPAGSSAEARLRVHYPEGVLFSDFTTSFTVQATAQGVAGARSAMTGLLTVDHDTAPPLRSDRLTGPASTLFVAAGATSTATFLLANLGGAASAYRLDASATGGWAASAVTIGGRAVDEWVLEAGDSVPVVVSATAPQDDPGHGGLLRLDADPIRAEAPAVSSSAALRLNGPAPVVESIALTGPGPYAGDAVPVAVTVLNAGNQPMQEPDTLTVRGDWAEGAPGFASALLAPLEAGQRATVAAEVPKAQAAGPATLTATLDGGSPEPPGSLAVTVYDAVLTFQPPAPLDGVPASAVPYRVPPNAFFLRNNGDREETFKVDVVRGEATIDGPSTVTLLPGEGRHIAIDHVLPAQPGNATAVELTLRASLRDAPTHLDHATVWTTVRDRVPPVAGFAESLPPAWKAGRPLDVVAEASDNTAVASVLVRVENATGTFDLPVNETLGVVLRLPVGNHVVSVRATDVHGNAAASDEHVVAVSSIVPPQILDAAVDNATGAQVVTARVLSPTPLASLHLAVDNGTPMELNATLGVVNVTLHLEPGNHTVEVVAVDEDGAESRWTRDFAVEEAEAQVEDEGDPLPPRDSPGPGMPWALLALAGLAAILRRRT